MRGILMAALCLMAALPAQASMHAQICAVMLLDAEVNARSDVLAAARAQLDRDGCEAGDALILVAAGVRPQQLSAGLCRPSAGIFVSETLSDASDLMQVNCEYPGQPSRRRAAR